MICLNLEWVLFAKEFEKTETHDERRGSAISALAAFGVDEPGKETA